MVASAEIIVLGMHRSGTSAVTGALQAMGVFVGEPEDLTKSNWDNPRGFFERKDVRSICDALLRGAGADWWKLGDFDLAQIPDEVRRKQSQALQSLVKELGRHGAWALKEPRLCLLFPLLEAYLEQPLVLHVIRHPISVALSLQHRHGYSLQTGLALWERYNREALRHIQRCKVVQVNFDNLVLEPEVTLARVAEQLQEQFPWPKLDLQAGLALIDPGSRHQVVHSELEGLMTPEQRELWQALSEHRTPAPWSASGQAHNRLQLLDLERVHAALQDQAIRERDAHRVARKAKKEADQLRKQLAKKKVDTD